MDKGLVVVIGMSISYLFSLAGLIFAWVYYKKNKKQSKTGVNKQEVNRNMIAFLAQTTTQIGSPILGYIIPALIFAISFFGAYVLYKHFTRQVSDEQDES